MWLETLRQDLRYGARTLRRNPGFTGLSILALALGIAVNTVVFTAYKAFVARPIDARDSSTLVNISLRLQSGETAARFSYPDFEAYRDGLRSFSGVIAFSIELLTLSDADGVAGNRRLDTGTLLHGLGLLPPLAANKELASTFVVSENYFSVLGVAPVRGRAFHDMSIAELRTSPVVLISQNYWQERFGGDRDYQRASPERQRCAPRHSLISWRRTFGAQHRHSGRQTLRLSTTGQFRTASELLPDGPTWQVIGVARDTRGVTLDGSDSQQVYVPMPNDRVADYPLLLKTSVDPNLVVNRLAPIVAQVDPALTVTTTTLETMLRRTDAFLAASFSAAIASCIGLCGLLLASMGIYGLVSYDVVLRTREVGIRMAIGARKRDILHVVMRGSLRSVLLGLAVRVVLAIGAARLLRGVLYGLGTLDVVSFASASLLSHDCAGGQLAAVPARDAHRSHRGAPRSVSHGRSSVA
jgi:hypothetical protein